MLAKVNQQQAFLEIFRQGTKLTYKKGEFVIRPHETPPGVFYIVSGLIKAYNISKYGEENLLSIRKSGEIFPLIWAITNRERHIIYEALADTVVWRLSKEAYVEHIDKHPEALKPLLRLTVEMYRLHSEHIINLEYRSIRERVTSFLLNMVERFGEPVSKGQILLNVPLKQQDIASSINARRESTSRELGRLERLGLISTSQGKITLLKPAALRKTLE